jgi:hypothetical protein
LSQPERLEDFMAAGPAITKHALETSLIERCWKDSEFRNEVLKDPKGMLEAFLGRSLPPDFNVIVHEEDAKTLHFALPPAPVNASELSDEDLERVAGGTEFFVAVLVTATVASVILSVAGDAPSQKGAAW